MCFVLPFTATASSFRGPGNLLSLPVRGDSILDNAAYTDGEPAVADHLNAILHGTGRATLLAMDGSVTREVGAQLRSFPADATRRDTTQYDTIFPDDDTVCRDPRFIL